jgi:hypothetical protein
LIITYGAPQLPSNQPDIFGTRKTARATKGTIAAKKTTAPREPSKLSTPN